MLDRLLHHGHVLKCGPRSWRTKTAATRAGHDRARAPLRLTATLHYGLHLEPGLRERETIGAGSD